MEQFLLQYATRHQSLVKQFKPPRSKGNDPEQPPASPNITVATRIRPMLSEEMASGQVPAAFARSDESGVVDLHTLRRVVRGLPPAGKVFGPDHSTELVYDELVHPLLPWVWNGGVGTLFAYGQTGSGKTFTVTGLERLIASSFFDGALGGERKLHISIFELAGNSAYDLLNSRTPFSILEDSFGNTQLAGALEHAVANAQDLLSYINEATSFRQTASTEKNDGSSRSHAICRIRIEQPAHIGIDDGFLYLVDLAGSEAARDIFNHSADRMKETREINISLSVLKDCIRSLAAIESVPAMGKLAKKPYIPFRQSTLTKVLKHVFDPNAGRQCKTAVLACVNPSFLDTGATKNTLRYAEMLRSAETKTTAAGYDPANPSTWTNKDVRNYIKLKSGDPSVSPSDLAPQESGLQLLRLPADQFVSRCLSTEGVTEDQAKAFYAKFWRLHIDSQGNSSTRADESTGADSSSSKCRDCPDSFLSSRDPDPSAATQDFMKRIRPGMVVSWTPPLDLPGRSTTQNLALVLCPQHAVCDGVQDVKSNKTLETVDGPGRNGRYLCAMVLPGAMAGSYEVNLWRQVIVGVEEMEREVLLEYDRATRYYHATV
ncbi:hypothetical protein N7462_001002 [Penicillium macrosclerotiorum]|uniref:uncharacterized protein n=1 Tax=Penicillium macrosclerotiorum TaxID=303699 RepID=UPI0025499BAC|nr:uncharacterized protein N7462_001002 [Penicillium macrosclerotiorum]KAJ5698997.1 hypothetical protein N7462_001002 [Penicillium macrosclerotiorum]